jgi:hypothetical protein
MGASVPGITALLSRDFLKLVVIGVAIAVPIEKAPSFLVHEKRLKQDQAEFSPRFRILISTKH